MACSDTTILIKRLEQYILHDSLINIQQTLYDLDERFTKSRLNAEKSITKMKHHYKYPWLPSLANAYYMYKYWIMREK